MVYSCRNGQLIVYELLGEMKIAARQAECRNLPAIRYGMTVYVEHRKIAPSDVIAPTAAVWSAMLCGAD